MKFLKFLKFLRFFETRKKRGVSVKRCVYPHMLLAEAYAVLGFKDGCTPEQARAAYKRLALAHHPDKGGSEEDFVRITLAYERIIAETPKKGNSVFGGLWEMLSRHHRKSELTIRINVEIDVREVYGGAVKKLAYKRRLRDGRVVSAKALISLANFQHRHVFEGVGDEGNDGIVGDLVVKIRLKNTLDEDQFFDPSINNADLHVTKGIRLADHLLGCSFCVDLPDGSTHDVDVRPLEKDVIIVPSMGFPTGEDTRGDLVIKLTHEFDVKGREYLEDADFVQKIRQYFI